MSMDSPATAAGRGPGVCCARIGAGGAGVREDRAEIADLPDEDKAMFLHDMGWRSRGLPA